MRAYTPRAFSDLKFYIAPTHVTKKTCTTVFKVQKPNFVLLKINMYFGEIAYPLLKVLANIYLRIFFNVFRANI